MIMTSVDKKLEKQQDRVLQRKRRAEELRQKAVESIASTSLASTSQLSNSSSDSSSLDENECNEFKRSQKKAECSRPTASKQIFSTHVTSALDRNKISDREALRLMIPLAAALGHDPSSLPISRSTIRRRRKNARIEHNMYKEYILTGLSLSCALGRKDLA